MKEIFLQQQKEYNCKREYVIATRFLKYGVFQDVNPAIIRPGRTFCK